VAYSLNSVTSLNRCTYASAMFTGHFHVDLLGPTCNGWNPGEGDTLRSPTPGHYIVNIFDSNRVASSSAEVRIQIRHNGVRYDTTYTAPHMSLVVRRDYVEVEPRYMSCGDFQNGDTIMLCLMDLTDSADVALCPNNHLQSSCCVTYYTSFCSAPTIATVLRPLPGGQVTLVPGRM